MASIHDTQRAADAAFFEDWADWSSLGGPPKYNNHPIGRRPTGAPTYHCTLRRHSAFAGGPAFEIAVPQNLAIDTLLRRVGGRRYPHRRSGPVEIWFVAADRWSELRAVLPQIRATIARIFDK